MLLSTENKILGAAQFEQLFFEYQPRLLRFAVRFVDEPIAEDIVQNCFLRLWNKREQTSLTNVQGLLFMMVRNECLNELKRRYVTGTVSLDDLMEQAGAEQLYWQDMAPNADAVLLGKELQKLVDEAMTYMSDKTREIFVMSRQQGLKPKEIADELNITRQAVEKHINSALATLEKHLPKNLIWVVAYMAIKMFYR